MVVAGFEGGGACRAATVRADGCVGGSPWIAYLAMRAPRTIVAYLLREVVLYTVLGLAAIIVVLVTQNLMRALGDLVDAGFTGKDLLLVVRLLGTMLVVYALPISFLFGVLLAVGRMAADVEITAMRACGIGMRTFMVPILALGLLFSALSLRLTLEAEPAARREMRDAIKTMLARGGVIEPGKFSGFGSDRMFYVESRDEEEGLQGIVIYDRTSAEHPFLVFAKSGKVTLDDEKSVLVLALSSGDIHVESPEDADRYQRIHFERFEYGIDVGAILGDSRQKKPKEMSMAELSQVMERAAAGHLAGLRYHPYEYALHWHRRYAGPLASVLFGLVGVPIAMRRTRGARSMGMLWCAALAFGYYILQSFCEFLSVQGWFPPAAAPWIPNAGFALLGIGLLVRARRQGM